MILREFFNRKILVEGGNLELPGGHQAQQIDLKVHNRAYMVPVLNTLLYGINDAYAEKFGGPLWNPKTLSSKKFLSGSSLHFFNTDIPDDEFVKVKPKVGDIDTQVNKESEENLEQFLNSVQDKVVGNAKCLGFQRGNEQFSSLWELTDPPIKVQIDLEFVAYDNDQPTDWAAFSHSSSWDDLGTGIKGVFHKYIIRSFTKLTTTKFLLRKLVGRGKARAEQDVPTTDSMFSFAVSSKEGGGLRASYEPVTDEKGKPLIVDGLPVMRALPASGYETDIGKIFQSIFGKRIAGPQLKKVLPKTWSFTGLLEIMNLVLSPEEKEQVVDAFVDKLFAPGVQGLYKNDADRDISEKNVALNKMIATLKVTPPKNLEQMRHDYKSKYKMTTEGPIGLDQPVAEAGGEEPKVQAQLRKGMPHLRDLKPADFLDLVDEMKDKGGKFKLQNIPLNVKIDGFGGRLGKNADGKPFMGTSRTEPRYQAGFVKYHQEKGTTDPEILGRAANFDKLFYEMMAAIKAVDGKLGPDALVDRQITCEVLFLPFATQTEEGKLKFVGIEYDQLPQGVDLVLVPFRVVEASTGEDVPDADKLIQALTDLGQNGSVMFMSNKLLQKKGLDVTEIINPLENLEELKSIVSGTAGKRDRASIQLRREVEEKLKPIQIALEKAIDEDPNIVGKDILGQDYEGIVINSRLGPIKVTSEKQKDIIVKKNAAQASARADRGRDNANKIAVVAIGSFVGHRGHEELFNYTINKAKEVGGDPYLFIGNAEGKDDPIPPAVKVETWHRMYPKYAKQISTVIPGGTLLQKIKHELINPLPNKPPRYDNIIIMVGEDQANMPIAGALMKAVNKFQGYEHVKVNLEVTPRGTGMSFTKLRNILKDPNATPEQQLAVWEQGFDVNKLGADWIKHLMELTRKGMNIAPKLTVKKPAPAQKPVAERLSSALIRPRKIIAQGVAEGFIDYAQRKLGLKWGKIGDVVKGSVVAEYLNNQNDSMDTARYNKSKFKLVNITANEAEKYREISDLNGWPSDTPLEKVKGWGIDDYKMDRIRKNDVTYQSLMKHTPVVSSRGFIINGNHRVARALEMGIDPIPILKELQQGVAEGLDEAVGGNYLYHATGSDINDLKNIISNGLITNTGNQERTGSKLRAVSFTRNWRYALTTKDDDNQEQSQGIANGVIFVVDQSILKQKNKMQSVDQPANIVNELKAILAALPTATNVGDLFNLLTSIVSNKHYVALSQLAGTPLTTYGSPAKWFIKAVTNPYLADKTNQQALANAQSKIKQAISYFVKTSAGKSVASAGGSTGSEYEEVILTPLNYVPFRDLGVVGYMINPGVDSAKQQEIRNLFAKAGVKEMPIPNSTRPGKGVAEDLNETTSQLGPQLYTPHPKNLDESMKPEAALWTSTASGSNNGYTSAWVEWAKSEMPQWVGHSGFLYDVSPNARILTINSDRDAMRVAKKYGMNTMFKWKATVMDLFMYMPWKKIAKDYDAIHHVPSNRGADLFMHSWDVESTAWFNTKMLLNKRKVPILASGQGVAEGGEKYKVKSIGTDKDGDYYISPSTGKKVYKSGVKVGDHENPKTGEHKGVAEKYKTGPAAHFTPKDKHVKIGQFAGGDGGGGESIKHEASYPGNIGMMELAKFFSMADEEQKTMFKQLLDRGKKGLAWKLVQDIVGVKLQGAEFTEGKITLSTDPNWYGAEVGNYKASGPVVNIPANQLVGFEPDDKMNQPKSKANVKKIVAGLKQGDKLPPLLVRKYKDGYQVLDGHHRFWAYKLIGVKSIPAQIVPAKDIEEISKQGVAEKYKTGPAAHFTPKDKHVKIGQFAGGEGKIKGADGKACWDGYRYAGTKKGKDKCVPVSEDVEMIFANLINKIIINETVQNNKRRS